MSLVLIHPAPDEGWADMRLAGVLSHALAGRQVRVIRRAEELKDLTGQRLLFAAALGEYGVNLELTRMLSALRRTPDLLSGATAGIIIDGLSPLYTKSPAGELALAANLAGCALVGRPLVEGAGQLHNFRIQAKNAGTDLLGAYRASAADLAQRVETALQGWFTGQRLGQSVLRARLGSLIFGVEGVANYVLAAPAQDVAIGAGQLPVLGQVTVEEMT